MNGPKLESVRSSGDHGDLISFGFNLLVINDAAVFAEDGHVQNNTIVITPHGSHPAMLSGYSFVSFQLNVGLILGIFSANHDRLI